MATIPLHPSGEAVIDGYMLDWASRYKWYRQSGGYAVRYTYHGAKGCQCFLMHRFIAMAGPDEQVHHRNGDKLDNRYENLTVISLTGHSSYHMRLRPPKPGRYRGVYPGRNGKSWNSKIKIDGKSKHLGTFKTPEEAALGYNRAAIEAFGEGCYQNEIKCLSP